MEPFDQLLQSACAAISSLVETGSVRQLEELVAHPETPPTVVAVLTNGVGEWHMARREWSAALPWLERTVDANAPDYAVVRAALCAFNAGEVDRAAELASLADGPPDLLRIRATVYEEKGDYESALAARQTLADLEPNDLDNLVATEVLKVRHGDASGLGTLVGRIAGGSPETKMRAAYLVLARGRPEALELALSSLKAGSGAPEIALAYINLFFAAEAHGHVAGPPSTVEGGTAVVLKSGDEVRKYYLTDERLAWSEVLPSDDDFAMSLLGRSVGDEVQQRTMVDTRTWEITEIQSEVVHALQRTMGGFERSFPGERSFAALRDDTRTMVQIFASAFAREEHIIQLAKAQRDGLAIGAAAEASNAHWIDVWGAVLNRPDFEFRAADTSEADWQRQRALLSAAPAIVMDISAVCAVGVLDLDAHPEWFAPWRLLVARAVVDDLQDSLARRNTTGSGRGVVYSRGGIVQIQELGPDERDSDRKFMERLLAFVEDNCDVIPVGGKLAGSPTALRDLSEVVGKPSAASIRAAHEQDALLWSDEFGVRAVARHLLDVGDVWSQAVLEAAGRLGALSEDDYVRTVQRLAAIRVGYLIIDSAFLRRAARVADFRLNEEMMDTLRLLGHPDCPTAAAVKIGLSFLTTTWRATPAVHQIAIVQAVWSSLRAGRTAEVMAHLFWQELGRVRDPYLRREIQQVFRSLVGIGG